ncbi:MAG TPA: heavy metal translocating P-type ATPase, partial [Candidatus Binataceae bacterium]
MPETRVELDYQIKHNIPGRARFYIPAIERIKGLAQGLSEALGSRRGAIAVRMNPFCSSATINYDKSDPDFVAGLEKYFQTADVARIAALAQRQAETNSIRKPEEPTPQKKLRARVTEWLDANGLNSLALSTAGMFLSVSPLPFVRPIAIGLSFYNALPIAYRAYNAVWNESRLNVDVLDTLAFSVASMQGRFFTAAFITWLITLGDWIRDRTAAESKKAITGLLDYQGKKAWVLRDGEKISVPAREIAAGEVVIVYPGDMIPVDGEVIRGRASVDQRSITGESMPVLRHRGDKVFASSSIHEGKLYLRASHVASESLAAKIVELVEMAPVGETRAQNYAEKFADRLVAPTLALGSGLYLITRNLNMMLSVFIVDFGTGIRVAAPTSVLASMSAAVQQGVLIRGGSYMERLGEIDTIVFDKTGTLTRGAPRVLDIISYYERIFPPLKLLELAAAAERRFNHPVALATLAKAKEAGIEIPERNGSKYRIGMGVEAGVNGYYLHLGNERFLRENNVDLARARLDCKQVNEDGLSSLMLAINGELAGQLVYADRIRPESADVIRWLKERNIRDLVMMTGDNPDAARAVARKLGLGKFFAEALPHEKADLVEGLQKDGRIVVMVGDGINDAPALARASVGVAMSSGTEIA